MSFDALLNQKIDLIADSTVKEAMRYSLLAGGKRIRPNLLYAVMAGYGRKPEEADEFACALEMIHTYSLIHDDLPAMDNDDLRRGKPTCHKQFGEAEAILAGDGLLTYAFETAAASGQKPELVRSCIQILAQAAGPSGMVYGQCLDIREEESAMNWEALAKVHRHKTGDLLAAPLMMGAVLCLQDQKTVDEWQNTGYQIGLAFQIQDDILDVSKTAAQLGKSNSDQKNGKVTSVTLLGIEKAQVLMNQLYDSSCEKILSFRGFDSSALMHLLKGIQARTK